MDPQGFLTLEFLLTQLQLGVTQEETYKRLQGSCPTAEGLAGREQPEFTV